MEQRTIRLNPRFKELWNNTDRRIIMYGSRSSSKSAFICTKIVQNMITHKYFKGIAMRTNYNNHLGSCFEGLVREIKDRGIEQYFNITKSPYNIIYIPNGNEMLFRGFEEPGKLKSIKDPTFAWFEEEVPDSYDDYMTVSLSLRTQKADYIQEVFTINPTIPDYTNHWFWKKYFEGHDELSYRIEDITEYDGQILKQYTTVHNSTWRDNLLMLAERPQFAVEIEADRETDPESYTRNSLGLWCQPKPVGQFYKDFKLSVNSVEKHNYDPELMLHLSFDHNNNPYSACTIYQCDKDNARLLYQIDEICLKSPNNKLSTVLDEICIRYRDHRGSVSIYGDPNGYKEDSTKEKGDNAYKMIFSRLSKFRPLDRTTRVAPSVRARQNWLNDVFLKEDNGLKVLIGRNCRNSINDFTMMREDPVKGGKLKEKWVDPETGINSERYGHCSDSYEYMMCVLYKNDFDRHKNGGLSSKISVGRREQRGDRNLW